MIKTNKNKQIGEKMINHNIRQINETDDLVRDKKSYSQNLVIETEFEIRRENYKSKKKWIEELLRDNSFIFESLPRYSERNDSINLKVVHVVNFSDLHGFIKKDEESADYKFHSDISKRLKKCFFQTDHSYLDYEYANRTVDSKKFNNMLDRFETLENISVNDPKLNTEKMSSRNVLNMFKNWADSIRQDIGLWDCNSDFEEKLIDKTFKSNVHWHVPREEVKNYIRYIHTHEFEKEFHFLKSLNESEKFYSNSENVSLIFDLNNKFQVNISPLENETNEELIERAKTVVLRQFNCLPQQEIKSENLILKSSNLIEQKVSQ